MIPFLYIARSIYLHRLIDHGDFTEWLFFSKASLKLWPIFYALISGFFIAGYVISETRIMAALGIAMLFFAVWFSFTAQMFANKPHVTTKESPQKFEKSFEVIYVIKRDDGIIKIGKTNNLCTRIIQHKKDYRSDFSVLASWVVLDAAYYEQIALNMTNKWAYQENKRRELRQMPDDALSQFIIDFTVRIQDSLPYKINK